MPDANKEDSIDLVWFYAVLIGTSVLLFIGHLLDHRRLPK